MKKFYKPDIKKLIKIIDTGYMDSGNIHEKFLTDKCEYLGLSVVPTIYFDKKEIKVFYNDRKTRIENRTVAEIIEISNFKWAKQTGKIKKEYEKWDETYYGFNTDYWITDDLYYPDRNFEPRGFYFTFRPWTSKEELKAFKKLWTKCLKKDSTVTWHYVKLKEALKRNIDEYKDYADEVEAMQWFKMGDHPAVEITNPKIWPAVQNGDKFIKVNPGDWVTKNNSGKYNVIPNKEFWLIYTDYRICKHF